MYTSGFSCLNTPSNVVCYFSIDLNELVNELLLVSPYIQGLIVGYCVYSYAGCRANGIGNTEMFVSLQ